MILISIAYNFGRLIMRCNEQERRQFEFVIIVNIIIVCRFVCTSVLTNETQQRKYCLEKESLDGTGKVSWEGASVLL